MVLLPPLDPVGLIGLVGRLLDPPPVVRGMVGRLVEPPLEVRGTVGRALEPPDVRGTLGIRTVPRALLPLEPELPEGILTLAVPLDPEEPPAVPLILPSSSPIVRLVVRLSPLPATTLPEPRGIPVVVVPVRGVVPEPEPRVLRFPITLPPVMTPRPCSIVRFARSNAGSVAGGLVTVRGMRVVVRVSDPVAPVPAVVVGLRLVRVVRLSGAVTGVRSVTRVRSPERVPFVSVPPAPPPEVPPRAVRASASPRRRSEDLRS